MTTSQTVESRCPAHQLALEAETVLAAIDKLHADPDEIGGARDRRLHQRLDAIELQASYTQPTSAAGAIYLMLVAYGRFNVIENSICASEYHRDVDVGVIERCQHNALRFFEATHRVTLPRARDYHSGPDPTALLDDAA
jgi:hypothetical protein